MSDASPTLVLTPDAIRFLQRLHQEFDPTRRSLLEARRDWEPGFLEETAPIRASEWRVATVPADLQDRRVEITGPTDRKMMINALNSGAQVFMADFEDSLSPTWENVIEGQLNLQAAVRRTLQYTSPEGKSYQLKDRLATLVVRPRGWHLEEAHFEVAGTPISASLFDFGLHLFHNAHELLKRGSGPYFYLPKMESHLEARLWARVFEFSEAWLGLPRGSIRCTVLIETLPAAFQMEEILHELRASIVGLNAGRWDYLFSVIKRCSGRPGFHLPDRSQLTMTQPFMRAYAQLLVQTCHRRGAHAIGGMAAFIPSRSDAEINRVALAKVREDKERETGDGFDGTWVAHPDLVPVAREAFDRALGKSPHQKHRMPETAVRAEDLMDFHVEGGRVTAAGLDANIDVTLLYLDSWLRGVGAAAIHHLMEDAATAEISRSLLWLWTRNQVRLEDGRPVTPELYRERRDAVLARLAPRAEGTSHLGEAVDLLDTLVLSERFEEFLTLPAYRILNRIHPPISTHPTNPKGAAA